MASPRGADSTSGTGNSPKPCCADDASSFKLEAGLKGTKNLVQECGDRLVCLRYRYDEERRKRFKTVELIVEETDWEPKAEHPDGATIVRIRVGWQEVGLREKVKASGEKRNPGNRVWELRYDRAKDLGLEDRIVRDDGI